MSEFFDTVLSFPTVLFTFLLVVVAAYWLLVVLGGADVDLLDADVDVDVDADGEPEGALAGLLASLGLHGVPITVSLSVIVVVAWFVSLVGTVLVGDGDGAGIVALLLGVLVVALVVAWSIARAIAVPLRRVFSAQRPDRRSDFVGKICTIRTAHVTNAYGQAEVRADDGSTATIQVRTETLDDTLVAGTRALVHGYDVDGEHFWVSHVDASLDPNH